MWLATHCIVVLTFLLLLSLIWLSLKKTPANVTRKRTVRGEETAATPASSSAKENNNNLRRSTRKRKPSKSLSFYGQEKPLMCYLFLEKGSGAHEWKSICTNRKLKLNKFWIMFSNVRPKKSGLIGITRPTLGYLPCRPYIFFINFSKNNNK